MDKKKAQELLEKIEGEGGIDGAMSYGIDDSDFREAGLPELGKEWESVRITMEALRDKLNALRDVIGGEDE